MNELAKALIADSYAAHPAHIVGGLDPNLAHSVVPGTPHTIYQELWHIVFWQQITLDWVNGLETPFPTTPSAGFATIADGERESWDELRQRFIAGAQKAAAIASDEPSLDRSIRCPSRPGQPVRIMSIREQLESLATHNAYHLGRIVLLRQLHGAWPPPSGGYSW
jgi:uncharacterized damage-inducible protein DinB